MANDIQKGIGLDSIKSMFEQQRDDIKEVFKELIKKRNILGRRPTPEEITTVVQTVTGKYDIELTEKESDYLIDKNPWLLDGTAQSKEETKGFQDKELSSYIMKSMSGSDTERAKSPSRAGFIDHLKEKLKKEEDGNQKSSEKSQENQLTAQTIQKLEKDEGDFVQNYPKNLEKVFKSVINNEEGNNRINENEYRATLKWATFARYKFEGEKKNKVTIQVKLFNDSSEWIDVAKGLNLQKAGEIKNINKEDVQRVTDYKMHTMGIDPDKQKLNSSAATEAPKELKSELTGAKGEKDSPLPQETTDKTHIKAATGTVNNDAVDNMNEKSGYLLDFVQRQLGYFPQSEKNEDFIPITADKMPLMREVLFMLRETIGQQQSLTQSQNKTADTKTDNK